MAPKCHPASPWPLHTVNETLRGQTGSRRGQRPEVYLFPQWGEVLAERERSRVQRPEIQEGNGEETAGRWGRQTRDTGLQRGSHTTLGVEEVSLRTQEDESKRGAKTKSLCLDLIYSLDKHLGPLAMLQALAWSFTGEFSGCGGGTDKVSH